MTDSAPKPSLIAPAGWHVRSFGGGEAALVLHIASFALDPGDGTFGAAATGRMRPDDAFAALIEYRADAHVAPGVGLFAGPGWRARLRITDFAPAQLQVARPGQLGAQRFFTHAGRPFCLYAVVLPVRKRPEKLVGELSRVLAAVRL
jgi:hypothetical protein